MKKYAKVKKKIGKSWHTKFNVVVFNHFKPKFSLLWKTHQNAKIV